MNRVIYFLINQIKKGNAAFSLDLNVVFIVTPGGILY